MFSNESPFFRISKNAQDSNLKFHSNSSNSLEELNSDFFSLEEKNKQFKTKGKFGFYNNGTPSQVKEYLDYFLKESEGKINLICFTGDNFPLHLNKNGNENPKKMKNSSSKDLTDQQSYDNSNLNNSCKNKNKEINEDNGDSLCPAPLCKKSFNSNLSGSTFNSSYNNNINNDEKIEDNINNIVNDIGKMEIDEKKLTTEKKSKINPYMSGRVLKLNIEY